MGSIASRIADRQVIAHKFPEEYAQLKAGPAFSIKITHQWVQHHIRMQLYK